MILVTGASVGHQGKASVFMRTRRDRDSFRRFGRIALLDRAIEDDLAERHSGRIFHDAFTRMGGWCPESDLDFCLDLRKCSRLDELLIDEEKDGSGPPGQIDDRRGRRAFRATACDDLMLARPTVAELAPPTDRRLPQKAPRQSTTDR